MVLVLCSKPDLDSTVMLRITFFDLYLIPYVGARLYGSSIGLSRVGKSGNETTHAYDDARMMLRDLMLEIMIILSHTMLVEREALMVTVSCPGPYPLLSKGTSIRICVFYNVTRYLAFVLIFA